MRLVAILVLSILFASFECSKSEKEEEEQCPPGSLNHVRVVNLLKKSTASPECLNEARFVFKRIYNSSNFIFEGHYDPNQPPITDFGFSVYVRDGKLATSVFQVFGDLVNKITVSCEKLQDVESKEIVKQVNDKCSNSLKQLTIERCKAHNLEQLKNVFSRVDTLTFSSSYSRNEVSPTNRNWVKIFPNVKTLTFGKCKISDWLKFIDGKYTNLIKLDLYLPESNEKESINDSHVANFIKSNTRIEHLTLWHGTLMLFKNASDYLIRLENLEMLFLRKDDSNFNEPIHFDRVQNFRYHLGYEVPENILLNQVRKLYIWILSSALPSESSKWTNFVTKNGHENLTDVELKLITLTKEQFTRIPKAAPKLQKLDIFCVNSPVFYADDVINFIANSTELNYLQLNGILIEEKEQARLEEMLKGEWFTLITPTNINILRTNAGGANSLVVNHLTQMLSIFLIVVFIKWF